MAALAVLLLVLVYFASASIFDTPNSNRDQSLGFQENECFKTSGDLTSWLAKATSGGLYKRWVRPGVREDEAYSPPLHVNVSIDMNSMASVDELNSEYKIILKIDLEWIDDRLMYNCSRKPVTVTLESYMLDRIWSPRIGVPNIKDPDTSIIQGEATLILGQLRTDGYIHIRHSLLLNLFCYLNFELFPFDKQECFIKLESRSYLRHDLILNWHGEHPFRNLESFQMTGFRLNGYQLYNDNTINHVNFIDDLYGANQMSQLMVKLHIEREWNNYVLEIYLPSILFVMISWLSFWMQITAAPARVSLGMTTMLTLVTSSRATRDKLPRIAYIHALDIWIAFCTCFIFLSLIEFALVSYIYSYGAEKTKENKQKSQRETRRRNSDIFSIANSRKEFFIRQRSDTTEYSGHSIEAKHNPQLVEVVSKRGEISLNIPLGQLDSESEKQLVHLMRSMKRRSSVENQGCFTRLLCCWLWCSTECHGQKLADLIDRKCRLLFPLFFAIFNITYWCCYLL